MRTFSTFSNLRNPVVWNLIIFSYCCEWGERVVTCVRGHKLFTVVSIFITWMSYSIIKREKFGGTWFSLVRPTHGRATRRSCALHRWMTQCTTVTEFPVLRHLCDPAATPTCCLWITSCVHCWVAMNVILCTDFVVASVSEIGWKTIFFLFVAISTSCDLTEQIMRILLKY